MSSSAESAVAASPADVPTGPFARPAVRIGVSLLLVYHLGAVLLEPLATAPQFNGPPAVLPEFVRPAFRPYATALSLDHSYKFFAPNPGDSHLVRYDLYFADGKQFVNAPDNIFPDRHRDWPRLLYHRYFMLTEHLPKDRGFFQWNLPDEPPQGEIVPAVGEIVPPPADVEPRIAGGVAGSSEDPRARFQRHRDTYVRGIAAYLAKKHGARRVDLFHVVHHLASPQEIIEGRKLDAPDGYRERLLISYTVPDPKPGSTKPPVSETTSALPAGEGRR
jgi:hypothetical protein